MLRALAVALTLALAVPVAADAAAPERCKKGYVLKTVKVKHKRVKRCVKKAKPAPKQPAALPTPTPGPGPTPTPTPAATPTPTPTTAAPANGVTTTRDDAAAQQRLGGGVFLERADFGSVSATYYRIFLYPDGRFTYAEVGWNNVSGELCTKVVRGTWTLKEGGRATHPTAGSGVYAIVTESFDGQTGDDLLVFSDTDVSHAWVGQKGQQFDVNPNMRDSC